MFRSNLAVVYYSSFFNYNALNRHQLFSSLSSQLCIFNRWHFFSPSAGRKTLQGAEMGRIETGNSRVGKKNRQDFI